MRPSTNYDQPNYENSVHVNAVTDLASQSKPTVLLPRDRVDNYAGAYDGIYAPSLRYPQFSLDQLYAIKGAKFIEEMLYMAACRAPFDLKRNAVLQDGWEIVPCYLEDKHPDYEEAKMYADNLRYALQNITDHETDYSQDFTAILFDGMLGAWTGYHVIEIDWEIQEYGPNKGKYGFKAFYPKTNQQMAFDVNPETLAMKNFTSYTPGTGYNFHIPVEKCVYYVHNQTNNEPAGNGDWRASYKHWLRLDANLKFWAMALERWGAPVMVAQYPAGSPAELTAAQQALNRIRQGAPAVLPDNIKYTLVTAPQQVFIGFEAACRYDEEQLAKNIVGNTLTTGAGDNSLALGQVHQISGMTYTDSLAERTCRTWEQQCFKRWMRYNYGADRMHLTPKLRLKKRKEGDVLKMAQAMQILIESGNMPAQSAVVRDMLNIPAISPQEKEMLEANKEAIAEAQAKIANGVSPSKVMKMSDYQMEQAITSIAKVIYHTEKLPNLIAKFEKDALSNLSPLEKRISESL